jgi:hypothetical protein
MSELEDPAVIEAIRGLFDHATGVDASADLAAFGIWDLIRADRVRAVQHVFHEQGRAAATSDMFNTLQQSLLDDHFPGLQATVALNTSGELAAPVVDIEDSTASGDAFAFGTPTRLVMFGAGAVTTYVAVVDSSGPGVSVDAVRGIDDTQLLTRIALHQAPVDIVALDDSSRRWWTDAAAWGRLALGWELVGTATAALTAATAYAEARVQFGRPIGTFQAVQHRLAETLVAVEAAQAILELPEGSVDPLIASMAKALAGQAYKVAAKNCLQVFGGIGFTVEHPFDRYMRRGACLERLLGSGQAITESLGFSLLHTKSVPALCGLQHRSGSG